MLKKKKESKSYNIRGNNKGLTILRSILSFKFNLLNKRIRNIN